MSPRLCQIIARYPGKARMVSQGLPRSQAPNGMLRRSMRVERFTGALRSAWDELVRDSRNGTFLFLRDYMEYHQDRFEDHSLLVFEAADSPVALLPASR